MKNSKWDDRKREAAEKGWVFFAKYPDEDASQYKIAVFTIPFFDPQTQLCLFEQQRITPFSVSFTNEMFFHAWEGMTIPLAADTKKEAQKYYTAIKRATAGGRTALKLLCGEKEQ